MDLIGVTESSEKFSDTSDLEDIHLGIDEAKLPEIIEGQIGKLNELDAGVKKALETAGKAEKRAQAARKLSAGWSLFNDKKKEAIEGLQEAGVELAEAVQLGTQAQKISFEFQTRLAEAAKYLFTLGVGNIAANRMVVRELEMRLHGASEKELSDLARQEVMSVVRQLNEQADLLCKQQQMGENLRKHKIKIESLTERTEHLELEAKERIQQHNALLSKFYIFNDSVKRQDNNFASLKQENSFFKVEVNNLRLSLENVQYNANELSKTLTEQIDDLNRQSKERDIFQNDILGQINALHQHLLMHQKDQRRAVNVRTALFVIWAMVVSFAVYLLR